jgi:hypothetical protein
MIVHNFGPPDVLARIAVCVGFGKLPIVAASLGFKRTFL